MQRNPKKLLKKYFVCGNKVKIIFFVVSFIANTFFRAGYIESWGRGIEKVMLVCKTYGCPKPEWDFDGTGLDTTLWCKKKRDAHDGNKSNRDVVEGGRVDDQQIRL